MIDIESLLIQETQFSLLLRFLTLRVFVIVQFWESCCLRRKVGCRDDDASSTGRSHLAVFVHNIVNFRVINSCCSCAELSSIQPIFKRYGSRTFFAVHVRFLYLPALYRLGFGAFLARPEIYPRYTIDRFRTRIERNKRNPPQQYHRTWYSHSCLG